MVLTRNQKRNLDISEVIEDESHKKCKLDDCETENIRTDEFYQGSSEESENNISEEQSEEQSESEIINNKLRDIIKDSIKNVMQRMQDTNKHSDTETEHDSTYTVDENDEYLKFNKYLNAIYEGDFFERHCIEDKKSAFRAAYSLDEIKKINSELEELQNLYKNDCPGVIDILKMNIDKKQKQQLLEKLYHYSNSEILSSEYVSSLKYLKSNLNSKLDDNLKKLEDDILKCSNSLEYSDNYREKILRSKMPFENKVIAYKRLDIMSSYEDSDSSEYAKHKNWMDTLLSIPFEEHFSNFNNELDIKHIRQVLDKRLSFLEKPKDQIINIVTQMMRNPDFTINAIGLYGVKGVGKTQIVKSISEALGRPYRSISLGGESDSSLLTGHHFTYVGSTPGRLIEILRETKCSNPIILFDELDKVSNTNHGKEIIGNLIHLTDKTTNNKYNYDRYFAGLNFDLSKVLFIFTYNDASKVDKILADRLFKIKIENYNLKEKLEITKVHLIKSILEEYNNLDISFDEDAIHYVVSSSKNDEGMRDIKRKFEIIISRVNTLMLTDPDDNIVRLKYNSLHHYYRENNKILKDHIDTLLSDSFSSDRDLDNDPPFGMYI